MIPPHHIHLQLQLTAVMRSALDATCDAFQQACAYGIATGRTLRTTSNARLHAACYRAIREDYGLSANLAIRAIARAASKLKDGANTSQRTSALVDYDARVLSVYPSSSSVSISTVEGRLRGVESEVVGGGPIPCEAADFVSAQLHRHTDGTYVLSLRLSTAERVVPLPSDLSRAS